MPTVIKLVSVGMVKNTGRVLEIYSDMNGAAIGVCPLLDQ